MDTTTIEKWDFFELSLPGPSTGNPFLDVSLSAAFSQGVRQVRVNGFYDGDGVYKIRFMPEEEGTWSYVTSSNAPALNGITGELLCTPATPGNHGPVRVAERIHFAYADGTPYYPVGTTCYVWNLQGDEMEQRTLKTLEKAPFNKIRMCVFPKRYTFNFNEPPCYPFPGEVKRPWDPANLHSFGKAIAPPHDFWDLTRFNPEYFQRLEQRILDLRERGIEADLILFHPYDAGAWGFDQLPAEVNDRLLRYLVARLAALRNLWWSFANEYDLFVGRTTADWDHYFQLVQAEDPYHHLRSIHNCFGFYDHAKPWVTHCSIQYKSLNLVPAWIQQYGKPVVVDECCYEGDIHMEWGDIAPEEMVERFWLGFCGGGYVGHGETYLNEEECLWWSKGGELRGESPARIAFLRQIIEKAPGCGIYPLKTATPTTMESIRDMIHNAPEEAKVLAEGVWNSEAAGYRDQDFFLVYYGRHQPRYKTFNLPAGRSYRIDVIDTWNMTITTFAENASGITRVELPARKYMAVRIQANRS